MEDLKKQVKDLITKHGYSDKKGSYGYYLKLNDDIGVKIYHCQYDDRIDAETSKRFRELKTEFNFLKKFQKTGVTPKPYFYDIIEDGFGQFKLVLCMEHVGEAVGNTQYNYTLLKVVKRSLSEKIETKGWKHTDLHEHNICIKNGQYYAIDFTPEFVKKIEKSA